MNQNVISDWQTQFQRIIEQVEREFLPMDKESLNRKPAPGKWSVLECVEHLNHYNRFYNAELERALSSSGKAEAYKAGWLGSYFVRMVAPENAKPMKTMYHLDPGGSQLSANVLHEFLDHQRHLLQLLVKAKSANLNARKVRVEVFRLLRIKTGDAFRFLLAHQQRHLQQAMAALRGG